MEKISTDNINQPIRASKQTINVNKAANKELEIKKALLQSVAIEEAKVPKDKISVQEKVSTVKPKKEKTSEVSTKEIEEELGDEGIIHTSEDTSKIPKTSLTKTSTTALAYSGNANSKYAQRQNTNIDSEIRETQFERKSALSGVIGNFTEDQAIQNTRLEERAQNAMHKIDANSSYWINELNNSKLSRNDLASGLKNSDFTRMQKRQGTRINSDGSSYRALGIRDNNGFARFSENATNVMQRNSDRESIQRISERRAHITERLNKRTEAIDRFKAGHEQDKINKIGTIRQNKEKETTKKIEKEREVKAIKGQIEEKVKNSIDKTSELKDKNGQDIKIKIKKDADGRLKVVEPDDIPQWVNYKNALEEKSKEYREKNPEPQYSEDGSKSESAKHAKWSRDLQSDQDKYSAEIINTNAQIRAIYKAIEKAKQAIREKQQ